MYVNFIAVRKYNFLDSFLFSFVYKILHCNDFEYHSSIRWQFKPEFFNHSYLVVYLLRGVCSLPYLYPQFTMWFISYISIQTLQSYKENTYLNPLKEK